MIATDFSKAFDKISHKIILLKLRALGFPTDTVHLGPLLFVLTINDVEHIIQHSDLSVYADDMKVSKDISNSQDSLLLQEDLNNFFYGALRTTLNSMSVNASPSLSPVSVHLQMSGTTTLAKILLVE